MVDIVEKCKKEKKRVIKWQFIIYGLGNQRLEAMFFQFKSDHKNMSMSRCAFYVLKKYYTTALLRFVRNSYKKGLTYEECVQWMDYYNRPFLRDVLSL